MAPIIGSLKQAAKCLREQQIETRENEPMALHTSFCIGGPAGIFCVPDTVPRLAAAIRIARENELPRCILGKGSNVLFRDRGYGGVIIRPGGELAAIVSGGETLRAGAGVCLTKICEAARNAGLAGLEFAYGIPGSVGGAVYMDAGAFEGEMRQVLRSVRFLDENLVEKVLPADELEFGYRTSVFQRKHWVILEAAFHLCPGAVVDIAREMERHMEYRRASQPLEYPSAGSAFKRPTGAFAGALIDESGLRGYRVGGAAISEKHSGFIVNRGGATCDDVLRLADHVAETVREKTGFTLEKEITLVDEQHGLW